MKTPQVPAEMVLRCTVGRKVISIRRNPLYTVLLLRRRRHERHDVRRKNKNSSYRGTAATTQQQQQSDILTMHSYRRLTVHLLFTKSELCCVVASTVTCQPDGHELDFTSGWNLKTFVKKKMTPEPRSTRNKIATRKGSWEIEKDM